MQLPVARWSSVDLLAHGSHSQKVRHRVYGTNKSRRSANKLSHSRPADSTSQDFSEDFRKAHTASSDMRAFIAVLALFSAVGVEAFAPSWTPPMTR